MFVTAFEVMKNFRGIKTMIFCTETEGLSVGCGNDSLRTRRETLGNFCPHKVAMIPRGLLFREHYAFRLQEASTEAFIP